jgi:hypothetical protein
VQLVLKVHKELLEHRDQPVLKELQVHKVQLVQRGLKVHKVLQEPKEQTVTLVRKEHRVRLVHKAQLAQVHKAYRARSVPKEFKALLVLELKVHKEYKVPRLQYLTVAGLQSLRLLIVL